MDELRLLDTHYAKHWAVFVRTVTIARAVLKHLQQSRLPFYLSTLRPMCIALLIIASARCSRTAKSRDRALRARSFP